MKHIKTCDTPALQHSVDCGIDSVASLVKMFVQMVQSGRIAKGQCPALRPVFLKPHGVVRGTFRIRRDLPQELRVGLFCGKEYPAWVRFSSDTLPTTGDYKTTLGIAIKLFGAPVPKIFGPPNDATFDFILQNADTFFVNSAADMCAFTKAGVVDGDYGPYLETHPRTAKLLAEMARPVSSVLSTAYWSGVPFKFGADRYVKYKIDPTIKPGPIFEAPSDPSYLAAELEARLKTEEAVFRFSVQLRTEPAKMPLDEATVAWDESASPPLHVADLILHRQNSAERGQTAYGENLSWNIWRVTEEHAPVGSIAEARRIVYAASADQRRNVNGIPDGEPAAPRPVLRSAPCIDTHILRAAIHPAIGVARIGDSKSDYYIGPEVVHPPSQPAAFYRDAAGALKRQAARFRIFGYNAAGEVVRELDANDATIEWTVHLANRKAQWYQFQAALDIPEAAAISVQRRNPDIPASSRDSLAIDPGPRHITGRSVTVGDAHRFDSGRFKGIEVPLGEIRTDDHGRLLVLGGFGNSASPSGALVFKSDDPSSFNNADDWYDDTSDGPVTASVSISGRAVPVDPAWVVVAPPNYAPDIVGWRTLYDLLVDVYVKCGWMEISAHVSFANDILPLLRRLSNLQWVNKGFAALFGKGRPMDFHDDDLVARLARGRDASDNSDPHAELRRVIFHAFRVQSGGGHEPRLWPWIYGDAFGLSPGAWPDSNLTLGSVQEVLLRRWADGDFVNDWKPSIAPQSSIDQVLLPDQPGMLDKASLQFCLGDAFHPGCEMTWPMRHASLYERPFRIRHRAHGIPQPDYGKVLTQLTALQPGGPLYAQGPGDITKWMALPWQGDTAFCRSGYEPAFDPYLPTYWPARVPNQVLTEEDYAVVIDKTLPREQRVAAFNNRAHWIRVVNNGTVAQVMMSMIAQFGAMGIVEVRPGIAGDPDIPETIFVESLAGSRLKAMASRAARLLATPPHTLTATEQAGWESDEQLEEFRTTRSRHR